MAGANAKATITVQLLKQRTGEFDLGSIQQLDLAGMGLQDLGCLEDCTGLLHLDLSHNRVLQLEKLRELKLLESLNLSANSLSSLDGLEEVENLSSLNVSGNMIMSLDTLCCLSKLEKLTALRLQDKVHQLLNPVCQTQRNYKRSVCKILPQLKVLDGERVAGRGSDLYWLCDELESALEDNNMLCNDNLAMKSTPWPTEKLLSARQKMDRSVEEAEQGFNDILAQCKKQNEEAEQAIQNAQDALWSSK